MKLHLGCGQRYLDGYLNIDFPLSCHTAQTSSVADLHADITTLRYPAGSVAEVRLHHVFEHFPRPVACGLLACWYSWLEPGGILTIEVPDFRRTALALMNPFNSLKQRAIAERHLFGSHEAPWAVHCEGYTASLLQTMLGEFGFTVDKITKSAWGGTYNLEVVARRDAASFSRDQVVARASAFLEHFLVDSGTSELAIHTVWMAAFAGQLDKGWAA
ncbi:class I SAM-dependent methyltransferase [Geomonas paludis]|uniref:Class I SAM-dependent methyltransferase n=1 Tax=Geomonas paludis TaxID=2740185 RepID=A0A6V8MXW3_9BACT|nr:class I SAM-dependent methyltransferase [Geomonas paludis]UPU34378.1 class I SAM-dependent methyltransferase [Geomonas paludis]GFO64363.1 hypothetical protein GMPD_22820 [Geomonas paludis]